jgi:hypothetical protein
LLVSDAKTNEPLLAAIDKKFSNKEIVTMIASLDNMKEPTSLWADRLWTTLSYWNWIKPPGAGP